MLILCECVLVLCEHMLVQCKYILVLCKYMLVLCNYMHASSTWIYVSSVLISWFSWCIVCSLHCVTTTVDTSTCFNLLMFFEMSVNMGLLLGKKEPGLLCLHIIRS